MRVRAPVGLDAAVGTWAAPLSFLNGRGPVPHHGAQCGGGSDRWSPQAKGAIEGDARPPIVAGCLA